MSFVKNLAKIAVGVAIAKGVNEIAKSRAGQGSVLDGLKNAGTTPTHPGTGTRQTTTTAARGTPVGAGSAGGGLEQVFGQILSGKGGTAGGLGGLLDSLSQSSRPQTGTPPRKGSLGDLLNQSFEGYGQPEAPSHEAENEAKLLIRAMIMAAKADGRIDPKEQKRLLEQFDDASPQEMAFIEEQLRAPVDPKALAAEVPGAKRAQVYLMSIMAIDIDSPSERAYLHDLAEALGLEGPTVAAIHDRLGVPKPA